MSYYQKRTVSVKSNNEKINERWRKLLGPLKEKNEDMATMEEILEAEKKTGVLYFEFEYYTGEAFTLNLH